MDIATIGIVAASISVMFALSYGAWQVLSIKS